MRGVWILILVLTLMLCLGLITDFVSGSEVEPMEVYSCKDIYYVKGLEIRRETSEEVLKFKDRKSLINHLSEVTAEDVKECSKN